MVPVWKCNHSPRSSTRHWRFGVMRPHDDFWALLFFCCVLFSMENAELNCVSLFFLMILTWLCFHSRLLPTRRPDDNTSDGASLLFLRLFFHDVVVKTNAITSIGSQGHHQLLSSDSQRPVKSWTSSAWPTVRHFLLQGRNSLARFLSSIIHVMAIV